MVTPEEDKEAIDHALRVLVGRARRQAEDIVPDTESDKSIKLTVFYNGIHEMIRDLLDLVEFEVEENWGDEIEKTG